MWTTQPHGTLHPLPPIPPEIREDPIRVRECALATLSLEPWRRRMIEGNLVLLREGITL